MALYQLGSMSLPSSSLLFLSLRNRTRVSSLLRVGQSRNVCADVTFAESFERSQTSSLHNRMDHACENRSDRLSILQLLSPRQSRKHLRCSSSLLTLYLLAPVLKTFDKSNDKRSFLGIISRSASLLSNGQPQYRRLLRTRMKLLMVSCAFWIGRC